MDDIIKICGIQTLSSSIKTMEELDEYVSNNRVFIVIDEGLLVKNFFSIRTKNITFLSSKCVYKILLNGTPISKSEKDLFAQWFMLDWRILGYKSYYSFAANHFERDFKRYNGRVVRILNVDYLTQKISPYTYQVSQDECLNLPIKHHKTLYFSLTDKQYFLYEKTYFNFLPIETVWGREGLYRFFVAMSEVLSGNYVYLKNKKLCVEPFFENIRDNPRLKCLLDYLDGEEKVIIFARYKKEIDDIMQVLSEDYGENSCVRFDGTISLKKREENKLKFEEDDNVKFFVCNKSCASYGLNLQFCRNVIFYHNDWDLGTRLQAEDRVYRIGQKNKVNIIDIVCSNTMDVTIQNSLSRKENILGNINYLVNEQNSIELKKLLKEICKITKEEEHEQESNLDY